MLKDRMAEAFEKGTYGLPRKEGSAHEMCQPKCISTVAVKVVDLDPLDVEGITKAEIEGRRQAFIFEDFFRAEIPGYKNSKIIGLSHQIGVRETRRVFGEYRLTKEDCIGAKTFEDQIFLCGAPIEDHRKSDEGESETFWQYVPNGEPMECLTALLYPRKVRTLGSLAVVSRPPMTPMPPADQWHRQ